MSMMLSIFHIKKGNTCVTTISLILLGFTLTLVFSGCATSTSSLSTKAPADYPQLSVNAEDPNTLVFTKPKLNLEKFDKVYVAPVKIEIQKDEQNSEVTDEEARNIARYTETLLKDKLSTVMKLADKPAPDVLSMHFRITDLQPTSKAQIAMMVPPFSMVNLLSSKGAFMGSITFAGLFYEGSSTEASVAFVATRSRPGYDASSAFGKWSVAEKVAENLAEKLAQDLMALKHKH